MPEEESWQDMRQAHGFNIGIIIIVSLHAQAFLRLGWLPKC